MSPESGAAVHERYSVTTFAELGLAEPILKALADEGYATPTPIQTKAIPPVMTGSDLLGIAQTGTGKTAAFALPILHRLQANRKSAMPKGCRVLVLSPTRELASQIADSFRAYGRHMNLTVAVVFGGVAHRPQVQALARGVDVLIATPGRLIDHINERAIALQGTEILVLDEADQMLDLGFVKPIKRVVSLLSARRQTLLFSATMPREIAAMVHEFQRDPVNVTVTPVASTVERVTQRLVHIEQKRKAAYLAQLFADPALERALVFTRTKRGADRVAKHLDAAGVRVAAIHGNKSQRQREEALESFRRAKIRVLVATDIAARGIDIDNVSHVVNFELPETPEAYVHRIGRTGRAGASGIAISLCDAEERDRLRAIEKLTRQQIPAEDRRADPSAPIETTSSARPEGRRRGPANGRPNRGEQRNANHRGEQGQRRASANGNQPHRDRPQRDPSGERGEQLTDHRGGGHRNGARPQRGPSQGHALRQGAEGGNDRPAHRHKRRRPYRSNTQTAV